MSGSSSLCKPPSAHRFDNLRYSAVPGHLAGILVTVVVSSIASLDWGARSRLFSDWMCYQTRRSPSPDLRRCAARPL